MGDPLGSPRSWSLYQALVSPKRSKTSSRRSSAEGSPRKARQGTSTASDPLGGGVVTGVCVAVLLLCLIVLLSSLGGVSPGELDGSVDGSVSMNPMNWVKWVRRKWERVWSVEVGGILTHSMISDSISGWEEYSRSGTVNLDTLGREEYVGPPKIAFLFLVRGPMPLIPLWEKFLQHNMQYASLYIHASLPHYNLTHHLSHLSHLNSSTIFLQHAQQVRGVPVEWGGLGMVQAERALIKEALRDPSNQRFVLLSESCIPVRSFDYVREYLFSTNRSFITSHQTDWRYPGHMRGVPRRGMRKGSQWVVLTRGHAALVDVDREVYDSFMETDSFVPDESYIQSLVPLVDPVNVEPRSVSFVHWPSLTAYHPSTFTPLNITTHLIHHILTRVSPTEERVGDWWKMSKSAPCELNGREVPCFLFARKFSADSVPTLLSLTHHFGY